MSKRQIDQLTIGETAKVEELSGLPISALADEDRPKAKLLAALYFVFKKREDPAFSWNEAMGATFDEIAEYLDLGGDDEEDGDADPLEQSAKRPASKKPAKKTPSKK